MRKAFFRAAGASKRRGSGPNLPKTARNALGTVISALIYSKI